MLKRIALTATLALALALPALAKPVSPEAKAAYDDIQKTLGMVPSFFKQYPQESIASAWEDMKSVQLSSTTALSPKDKELIGLAVAAQIPCRFCVYFHTEASALNGATDRERSEALAMAGLTRKFSAVLFGNQADESDFRKDIDRVVSKIKDEMAAAKAGKSVAKPEQSAPVTDAKSAAAEMEKTFGFTPTWMTAYPDMGMAGAWKSMRDLEMNPNTALSGKLKTLIGVAVASQVPCAYCVYADTEFAKVEGAKPEEIREAVAMASIVRQWSTLLNGLNLEEKAFRAETDAMFRSIRKQMQKSPNAGGVKKAKRAHHE